MCKVENISMGGGGENSNILGEAQFVYTCNYYEGLVSGCFMYIITCASHSARRVAWSHPELSDRHSPMTIICVYFRPMAFLQVIEPQR